MALTIVTGFVLFSAEQLPQPQLKVMVNPPGYPVTGATWEVQIFQRNYTEQPWELAENATVLMTAANEGNFSYTAGEGIVTITYTPAFGQVTFLAQKTGFESATYRPQTVFYPNEVGYLLAGFYLFGGGLSVYEISFEIKPRKKEATPLRILRFSTLASVGLGYILTVEWIHEWNFGTAWGFGNAIIGGISFYPHLFVITIISVALSVGLTRSTRARKQESAS